MNKVISALSKALNVAESELSSALLDGEKWKDSADAVILEKFTAKITSVKEELKADYEKAKENLLGKTKKETAEQFEKHLREKYGLPSDLIGQPLLDALDKKVAEFKDAKTDPEKIKSSDVYIQGINDERKRMEAERDKAVAEWKEKYETQQNEILKEKTHSAVRKAAEAHLATLSLRDDLPEETRKAIVETYHNSVLSRAKYKTLENGDVIVVDDTGQMAKDVLGNPITIKSIIESAASIIPVKASSGKGSPGAGGKGEGGADGAKYTGVVPKSMDEYARISRELGAKMRTGEVTKEVYDDFRKQAEEAIAAGAAK